MLLRVNKVNQYKLKNKTMCLITKQKKPIKTKEDLTVYKVVTVEKNGFSPWSDEHEYDYKLNVLHQQEIVANNKFESFLDFSITSVYEDFTSEKYTHVHEGFHSSKTKKRIKRISDHRGVVMVKCIIPKGSLIYKDKTGLIVSNQIIIKEVIK